jgi:hypothetical protein
MDALPANHYETVSIYDDRGGLVTDYFKALEYYKSHGIKVRISGNCMSACVLALGVKNVCVTPQAVVKAHMARGAVTNKPHVYMTASMMASIPDRVAIYLIPRLKLDFTPETTLDYPKLLSLGIKPCDKQNYYDEPSVASHMRRHDFLTNWADMNGIANPGEVDD